MGLDSVELVLEVEERFGTSIPAAASQQIQTVGDLHSFLMKRIRNQYLDICPSAILFYPIRKILVDDFGVKRSSVRPSTSLATLIDEKDRGKFWQKIEASVASRLPRLKRSKWLQWSGDIIPDSCSTVAQLVSQCVEVVGITEEFGPDNGDAVWEIVCEIVAEVSCVDPAVLTPETNFIEDLWY